MMEMPFTSFFEAVGTKIAIGILTVATAATSGIVGYKIVKTVAAKSSKQELYVTVSDNGIGMSDEVRSKNI